MIQFGSFAWKVGNVLVLSQTGGSGDSELGMSGTGEAVEAAHKGTRFGRQELEGVLLDDVEGTLWPRALIERCRVENRDSPLFPAAEWTAGRPGVKKGDCPYFRRAVVGVDPPASVAGTCGITR
jgi:phage terminase large subunit-like protein